MELNYLLNEKGIDTKTNRVLVMRHVPQERQLRKVLPWLAAQKPEVFKAYQQFQWINTEKKLKQADYLASFIGDQRGRAIFIGLYRVGVARKKTFGEYWKLDSNVELAKHGMKGMQKTRRSALWFDLKLTPVFQDWKGKLIINWPQPAIAWCRWAENNKFPVGAILEESILDKGMPHWTDLVLTWQELDDIPRSWINALSQLQCIYFILDGKDGKGYVGSASGNENLYNRWTNYAATGHGGNKLLRKRAPDEFKFSILEVLSSGMEKEEIIKRESSWKNRLHTRGCGLNAN